MRLWGRGAVVDGRAARRFGLGLVGALVAGGCVVDLGTLGGYRSEAFDVNESGTVVGYAQTAEGELHAFRRSPRRPMEDLSGPYDGSVAFAVNNDGVTVGYGFRFDIVAVMWDEDGTPHDLGAGAYSMAYDVNDAGTIVGSGQGGAFVRDAATGELQSVPLPDGYEGASVNAINDRGTVAGQACDADQCRAAVWTAGTLDPVPLPPGKFTHAQATDINDRGTVVGYSYDEAGGMSATLWRAGSHRPIDITPPGASSALAQGINNRDQTVGVADGRAFGHDLRTGRSTDLGGLGGPVTEAVAINDTGLAVGFAQTTDPPPPGQDAPPHHAVIFTPWRRHW